MSAYYTPSEVKNIIQCVIPSEVKNIIQCVIPILESAAKHDGVCYGKFAYDVLSRIASHDFTNVPRYVLGGGVYE